MQSIISKWFSALILVLLLFSLTIPTVSHGAEADDRGGGSGESGGESAAEKEAAKEAAEAQQAAQDAADVNAAAAMAGVSNELSATAVSTAGPATPGNVSLNGVSMSKAAAMSAVGAVSKATNNGAVSAKSVGVDVGATVNGYASGKLSGNQVAGTNTGYVGTQSQVAKTEISNTVSLSAVDLAKGVSSLNTAPDIGMMAPSVQPSIPDRMFDATPIGSKPSSLSISFNGGFSMPGAPTPTSVKTQSIATTPSSNPAYNSFDRSVPTNSPGLTSVSVTDGKITGVYTDGSTRALSDREISAINSNTPTPVATSWTSGISDTFNSVVSSVTNTARTLGSYVGLTDAPAPAPTYTDLNSLADRLNATISAQALNDIGVAVTPGVVDALNANNISVATAPNVNYGFVDKSSLPGAPSDFDSQYTSNIDNSVTNTTQTDEDRMRALDAVAKANLNSLQQRAARESLEAVKDESLIGSIPTGMTNPATAPTVTANTPATPAESYDPFAPGQPANSMTSPPAAETALSDAAYNARVAANTPTSVDESFDPFAPGQPANTFSQNSLTAPTSVNTTNIGTVPAPGPIGSFTGTAGVSLDDVTTISVVNLSGSSNPAENAKAATPAQVAALGGVTFSDADIAALGKAVAGEAPPSIVADILSGKTLTASQLAEIGVISNVVTTRALADKASLFGPFNGSLESVVTAGLTDKNKGQFSAFNDNTIAKTEATYNQDPTAFNAVAKSMVDGTVAKTYGLNVAAPTPKANAYYNDSIANPDWAPSLNNVSTLGIAPDAHTAGSLPGEYRSVGQVEGVDGLNTAALSAMNRAATGGLVSGTGQYGGITPNTGAPSGGPAPAGPAGMGTGPDFSSTVSSPSVNTGRSPSVSSPTTNDSVSLPNRVSAVPTSRPTPSGVSLPDTAGIPSSRPSGGFVNTGDNPGNVNAPTYSRSIPGTPSLSAGFTNTGDNPGNVNAPNYTAAQTGTAPTSVSTESLSRAYAEYANSRVAATNINTGNNPGNVTAPNYTNAVTGTTNPNERDTTLGVDADTISDIAERTAREALEARKDADLNVNTEALSQATTLAAREALEARKDADLGVTPDVVSAIAERTAREALEARKDADLNVDTETVARMAELAARTALEARKDADLAVNKTISSQINAAELQQQASLDTLEARIAAIDQAKQMAIQSRIDAAFAPPPQPSLVSTVTNAVKNTYNSIVDTVQGIFSQDNLDRIARESLEATKDEDLGVDDATIAAIAERTAREAMEARKDADLSVSQEALVAVNRQAAQEALAARKDADLGVTPEVVSQIAQRVAREALEARKDADLNVSQEALSAANALAREALEARKDADLNIDAEALADITAMAAREALEARKDADLATIAASPIAERFARTNSFYSPTLDAMVSNPIAMGVNFDLNAPPVGAPVSLGFDPKTGYTDQFGNTLSIDPLSGVGTITNAQGDFEGDLTPAETMQTLSDGIFSNPAVQSYRSYTDIAAAEQAKIANAMAEGRIADAYAEYAKTRTSANNLAEQERMANIKDESLAPATTPTDFTTSLWSGVKDVALTTAVATANLARATVSTVQGWLGIEASVDTRVVSTAPLDGTYAPFGDNAVTGKFDGQLTTDQTGVTTEVGTGVAPEKVASVPQNTPPIAARFGQPTDNTFDTAPTSDIQTPSLGQPVSMGFDPNTTYTTADGKTMSIDPNTGKATAYDAQGNVMDAEDANFDVAMKATRRMSAQTNPNTNPPTSVASPRDDDSRDNDSDVGSATSNASEGETSVIDNTDQDSPPESALADTENPETSVTAPTGIVDRVVDTVTNTVKSVYTNVRDRISGWLGGGSGSLTDSEAGEQTNRDSREVQNEPVVRRELQSVTLHLNIPVQCPDTGLTTGYIYEAMYRENYRNGSSEPKYVVQPMCGAGGPRTYATEIARDLETNYGFGQIDIDKLLDLMEINFNPPNEVVVSVE